MMQVSKNSNDFRMENWKTERIIGLLQEAYHFRKQYPKGKAI